MRHQSAWESAACRSRKGKADDSARPKPTSKAGGLMQIAEKINWIHDYEFSGGTGSNYCAAQGSLMQIVEKINRDADYELSGTTGNHRPD
jgi:hypothetical protein